MEGQRSAAPLEGRRSCPTLGLRIDRPMDLENLTKQFTRFFVPGLAFLIFDVMVPTTALGKDLFFGKEPAIGATQAILLSIVAGYVLDSIRDYRFTLSYRAYDTERASLAKPPRVSRRLQPLRRWSHEEVLEIFP